VNSARRIRVETGVEVAGQAPFGSRLENNVGGAPATAIPQCVCNVTAVIDVTSDTEASADTG
jgi:hypothetical protein